MIRSMKKEHQGGQVTPADRSRVEAAERVLKSRARTIGQPPDTLIHIGERLVERPVISIIQVIDTVEVFRDIVTGMQEIYLAIVNNRMNEVMKFLTMIATIFMPLSFIVGLYGMNFHYMPELEWRWGYFIVLGLMALIVIGMVRFYRSRRWF